MEILKVNNLSKSYHNKPVLNNISFTINDHEIVGLLGPNGSGKSTLMKSICQLVSIDSGNIAVCNLDITNNRKECLANMSVLIEGPSLYPKFTASKMIEINARLRSLDQNSYKIAYDYLDYDLTSKISHLSIGMKQELALAICFMNQPLLYLLDEPTNGLDFDHVMKFRKQLLFEKKQGRAILISSHLLKELETLADRFLLIKEGKIVGEFLNDHNLNLEEIYNQVINDVKID